MNWPRMSNLDLSEITAPRDGTPRLEYDRGRRDENEVCALIADELAAQWKDEGAIQGACIVADAIRARRKR